MHCYMREPDVVISSSWVGEVGEVGPQAELFDQIAPGHG
jgi:hypothetical protein